MQNQNIKFQIEDTIIEGTGCRTPYSIDMTIIKPYQHLSGGSAIPALARGKMSFEGNFGDVRLQQTLYNLFTLAEFLNDNMQTLKQANYSLKEKITALNTKMITDSEYKANRIKLRKKMRSGEITPKEFQQTLTPYHTESEDLALKIEHLQDEFLEEYFPMTIPRGTRKNVFDILEGRKNLTK